MDPSPNTVALVLTPILVVAAAAELALARVLGRRSATFAQTVDNLAVALGQRAVASALGLAPLLGYPWLVDHLALIRGWSVDRPLHWVAAFFAVDLAMYARHRLAHRVALLWATHAVHHQSPEYNYTVGARLSWVQEGVTFALPVAVLGVPPAMAAALFAFANLWTFALHTELVGKLGPLDRVLMTPSNHRVHHGVDPQYLDRNFGAVLVVWDRLFGTWAPEDARPTYGALHGTPKDPVASVFGPVADLAIRTAQARGWSGRVATLLGPPVGGPDGVGSPVAAPSGVRVASGLLLAAGLAGALGITAAADHTGLGPRVVALLAVALALVASVRVARAATPSRALLARSAVPALAAIGLGACAPSVDPACLDGTAVLAVGTAHDGGFRTLVDGDPLEVWHGPQGGYHVLVDLRVSGVDAGLSVGTTVRDLDAGRPLSDVDQRITPSATDDACTLALDGVLAVLAIDGPDEVAHDRARVEVTVADDAGRSGSSAVTVELVEAR